MSVDRKPQRVLFVSYLFPPVGGVGVLRVAKFVKFLPEFGWTSSVLTVANPSVPLHDESLLSDIPAETVIRRAKTLEPGYAFKSDMSAKQSAGLTTTAGWKSLLKSGLRQTAKSLLQPDAQVLWYPAAVKEGLRLLREVPHDVIVASGPPFTNLLVGAALARKSGVPLVLDYRDEWDISNAYWENKRPGRVSNWVQRQMQSRAVRAATAIVATTPLSAAALQGVAHEARSSAQATHIYNGFDADDFSAVDEVSERQDYGNGTDLFRLSFAGTLWELTSIEPFVEGVRRLCEQAPTLAERLEIVIAGRRAGRQDEFIDRLDGLPCKTVRLGYLEHAEAIRLMMTSDSLLLLLSDLPQAERVISSKVFEYMGAKKPMFAVTPEGNQCDVLRQHAGATICPPSNPSGIAEALAARLEEDRVGANPSSVEWDFSQFERRAQAGQLAALLESVVAKRSETVDPQSRSEMRPQESSPTAPVAEPSETRS